MDLPKWTLDELITRYELEPKLNDTFVEGQFDKDILDCVCREKSFKNILYTADTIGIDDEIYPSHKLTKGNKQKIIITCRVLSYINNNVRFIVDRDNDHWFGELENINGLIWTEYCDIENYFFDEKIISQLIIEAGKAKITDWEKFYNSFMLTLKNLYAIRAAGRTFELHLDYINFGKYLKKEENFILFNRNSYIEANLHKINFSKTRDKFIKSVEYWEEKFNCDPRLYCRGHDFVTLIAWCIQKFKGVKSFTSEIIERTLVLLVPNILERFCHLL